MLKVEELVSKLSLGEPIFTKYFMLLLKKDILHWITILGWNNNTKVYVCDSILLMVQCTFYWYFGFRKVFLSYSNCGFFFVKKRTLLLWQVGELTLKKGFPFHFFITFFFQFYNKTLGFSQIKQAQHNRHILW